MKEAYNLETLKELQKAPEDLFLPRGQKLLEQGDPLSNELITFLKSSGIDTLWAVSLEELDDFLFKAKSNSVPLDARILRKEGELQQSLYNHQGKLVLKAGSKWTLDLARDLHRKAVKTLYINRTDKQLQEDEEKASLLRKKIFEILPETRTVEQQIDRVISRLRDSFPRATQTALTVEGLEELSLKIPSDVKPNSSDAFKHRLTKKSSFEEHTLEEKAQLVDFHRRSVSSLKEVCEHLVKRRPSNVNNIGAVVKEMIASFINSVDLTLHAPLIDQDTSSTDFVLRQNLNRCIVAVQIATELGYSAQQIYEMSFGAILHDIGMMKVPSQILMKKGPLDENEKFEVFKHPIHSLEMLQKMPGIPMTTPLIAYQCHERGDRSGYPKRKSLLVINKFARIVMIADMYSALTSARPHRAAFTPHQAMNIILTELKNKRIDSEIAKAFISANTMYPVGTWVVLNDQQIGKVISVNRGRLHQPVVRTFYKGTQELPKYGTINLADETDLEVAKTFNPTNMRQQTLAGV